MVAWDDDEYEICVGFQQDVIAELLWLLLDHVTRFYFKRLQYKRTKSILNDVKEVFKDLEDMEVDEDRIVIFSKRLRDFTCELTKISV